MAKFVYVVRFQERKNGASGGLGDVKSFRSTGNSPDEVAQKCKKAKGGRIRSVRKLKRARN